jgi:hypothetical protein
VGFGYSTERERQTTTQYTNGRRKTSASTCMHCAFFCQVNCFPRVWLRRRSRLVGLYNSLDGIAQQYTLPRIVIIAVLDPSLRLAA